MIVLGGLGSITGSVVAAVVLTIGLESLREFQSFRMVAYAFLLIVLMLTRPQGLFGTHELWDLPHLQAAARPGAPPAPRRPRERRPAGGQEASPCGSGA